MNLTEQVCQELQDKFKLFSRSTDLDFTQIKLEASWLEFPKDLKNGDIALPCFLLSRILGKSPQLIASIIASELSKVLSVGDENSGMIAAAEASGPFLNLRLSTKALAVLTLGSLLNGDFRRLRSQQDLVDEKIFVEYASLNTHKPVHVGHIRNTVLGDSIARLLTWQGKKVLRAFWLGDEGTHVAKCLWLFRKKKLSCSDLGSQPAKTLGAIYSEADKLLSHKNYTKYPFPDVIGAKVLRTEDHPKNKNLRVLTLDLGASQATVVTAAKAPVTGSILAYVPPNAKFKGKVINSVVKDGIESSGMVCSNSELEQANNDELVTLEDFTQIGQPLIEQFRFDNTAIGKEQPLLPTLKEWESEISKLLQELEQGEPSIKSLWSETRELSLTDFKSFCSWLNTFFDHEFFESQDGFEGKEIVMNGFEKGIFQRSSGAIGIDLSAENLGFCLLIKSDGTANYATRDIALAKRKFTTFGAKESIYVVDYNQTLHFKQLFKCLELLGISTNEFNKHISYGRVVIPSGEMSSRKGNVILFSDLVTQLTKKITDDFLSKYVGVWSDEELKESAYRISLATIRYGMLQQENGSKIVFDLNEWCNKSGNTGSYLLYAYARICSILREASISGENSEYKQVDLNYLKAESEHYLLLHASNFKDTATKAVQSYSPNLITTYLYDLAKLYSKFYHECSVLKAEEEELKQARIHLCKGIKELFECGFELLGILPVERM
jgi:arginyl-tRNA synthetase